MRWMESRSNGRTERRGLSGSYGRTFRRRNGWSVSDRRTSRLLARRR